MLPSEAFLRQEIDSASPAKLRWMLLQKAHGLSIVIRDLWKQGDVTVAKQWTILVLDIFTELLEGVVDPKHELARQQTDLYVFLTKLLVEADLTQDIEAMDNIREILEIEMVSWEMLVRKERGIGAVAEHLPVDNGSSSFASLDLNA